MKYYTGDAEDILVIELCERGDLLGYIRRCADAGARIPESLIWSTISQISQALLIAHSRDIVHADVKPQNVFLTDNGIKLGDYGLSDKVRSPYLLYGPAGTEDYEAPELLHHEGYNHQVDLWGVGCVVYEMAACRPYCTIPRDQILQQQFDFEVYTSAQMDVVRERGYSEELCSVIVECLRNYPQDRPTAKQIYEFSQQQLLFAYD